MIKKYLIFLDCVLILAFFANMGALTFTNLNIAQKAEADGKELIIVEANLAAAKIKNLEPVPKENINSLYRLFIGLVFHFVALALAFSYYIYLRFAVITRKDLFSISMYVMMLAVITLTDFFNNLGYWIGLRLFG